MPFFHPELGGSFSSLSIVNLDQVNVGWGTCSCIAFELTFPHIVKFTHCTKKWSFPCRISSVNVTKSAVFCGFGHIYWRKPSWKTSFFLQLLNYIHPKAYWGHSQTSIMELFLKRVNSSNRELFSQKSSRDHSFSTYAKFSEKLIFCIPRYLYVQVPMRIKG